MCKQKRLSGVEDRLHTCGDIIYTVYFIAGTKVCQEGGNRHIARIMPAVSVQYWVTSGLVA